MLDIDHWRGNNSELTRPKLKVRGLIKSQEFIAQLRPSLSTVFGLYSLSIVFGPYSAWLDYSSAYAEMNQE